MDACLFLLCLIYYVFSSKLGDWLGRTSPICTYFVYGGTQKP